ncbi:class A sortase [Virgibacillus salarius]|nr:class A sortase [Priestia megaterium]
MKKVTVFIIILFTLIGITFFVSPYLKEYVMNKKINKVVAEIKKSDSETLKDNREKKQKEEEIIDLPSEYDVLKNINYTGNPVAYLFIPSTELELPIFSTVNNNNLLMGAGEMKEYDDLGKGNYALAGHRMKEKGLLFHDVARLSIHDVIYVTDLDKVYKYVINRVRKVDEKDYFIIDDNGKDEITLITCDIPSKPESRVVASGDLVEVFDYGTKDLKSVRK